MLSARYLILNGEPDANVSPQGRGIKIMSKSNVAEKTTSVLAEVKTVHTIATPMMTVVKNEVKPKVE